MSDALVRKIVITYWKIELSRKRKLYPESSQNADRVAKRYFSPIWDTEDVFMPEVVRSIGHSFTILSFTAALGGIASAALLDISPGRELFNHFSVVMFLIGFLGGLALYFISAGSIAEAILQKERKKRRKNKQLSTKIKSPRFLVLNDFNLLVAIVTSFTLGCSGVYFLGFL